MNAPPIETPTGRVVIVGPTGVGKTQATKQLLENWVDDYGTDGVVVFDFGPERQRGSHIVGRRLQRFGPLPDGVWLQEIDMNAPRLDALQESDRAMLARENAKRAQKAFKDSPKPWRGVFVNDATLAFHDAHSDVKAFLDSCASCDVVVINALASADFIGDDPISRRERMVVRTLKEWATLVIPMQHRLEESS